MKPFLILQLRPETDAADHEYKAFLKHGAISPINAKRIRMEKTGLPKINLTDYAAVIVGGGPYNVSDKLTKKSLAQRKVENDLLNLLDKIIKQDFPYLGACYGLSILSHALGAKVSKDKYSEPVGATAMTFTRAAVKDQVTKDHPAKFLAFGGHKEATQATPASATVLASSISCPVQMIRVKNNIYASQFHPEADSQVFSKRILIYKNAGYFPPEDAEILATKALAEKVFVPKKILKRFTQKYSR